MNNTTIALAWVYATIFLGITILGLVSNSLPEEKAFF